ncbi:MULTISPECIES: hypothetical protein [Alteromonas]|jgi:hypothetical protein|uniref:Uncharacterized protein n=1 Tax=Alteromonas stellipolaris TaxID=233316 RepID=A0AAW7YXV3_9ALTE|nr:MULTISPECIES: hypothetical protein [Alteromonas]AMJ89787.1 hypothetical protein AV940_04480 [Alteromonas sp. Mac2]ALM91634.1 hypothetical protein AOR13_2629 [Alteromonas stellipolaris LMG 21856]AMJ73493.1 hypothetical protein AVL57_05595 [Alteromonas stellipolaris]AMJ85930.1 hypothetical protein AV939_04635 [Alteromonas sp. Mac1]AMJ93622.1 hypothetical protein AVL56_04435 [Alteromonas stellipolaris]
MTEKAYLISGRNTIIHKIRKLDLLVTNGDDNPPIIVTYKGIKQYEGKIPDNKRDAKMMDMELVDITTGDVFGDEKTLVFIQTLNGKEYKIDYTKIGTSMFIKIHQDSIF